MITLEQIGDLKLKIQLLLVKYLPIPDCAEAGFEIEKIFAGLLNESVSQEK